MARQARNPWDSVEEPELPSISTPPVNNTDRGPRTLRNPWDTVDTDVRSSDRRRRISREQYEANHPPGMGQVLDRAEVLASRFPIAGNLLPRSESSREFEGTMTPSERLAANVVGGAVPYGVASRAVSSIPLRHFRNPRTGEIVFHPRTHNPVTSPTLARHLGGRRLRVGERPVPDITSQSALGGSVTAADALTSETPPNNLLQLGAQTAAGTLAGGVGTAVSRLASPTAPMRFPRETTRTNELPPISPNPTSSTPSSSPAPIPFPEYVPPAPSFGRRQAFQYSGDAQTLQRQLDAMMQRNNALMGRPSGPPRLPPLTNLHMPPIPSTPQTPIPQSGNIGPEVERLRDQFILRNAPRSTRTAANRALSEADRTANAPARGERAVSAIEQLGVPIAGGLVGSQLHPSSAMEGFLYGTAISHLGRSGARRVGRYLLNTPTGRRWLSNPAIDPNTAAVIRGPIEAVGPTINEYELPPLLGYR